MDAGRAANSLQAAAVRSVALKADQVRESGRGHAGCRCELSVSAFARRARQRHWKFTVNSFEVRLYRTADHLDDNHRQKRQREIGLDP